MRSLSTALRGVSLRYKILIPFVLMSVVTWFIAADVLGRSSADSIRTHARVQAREVAESAAHQMNLRLEFAGGEVQALASEAQLMAGGETFSKTMENLGGDSFYAGALKLFMSAQSAGGAGDKDLVKAVVKGRQKPLINMRRAVFEPQELEDAALIKAAEDDQASSAIVKVKGLQKAYVVGAAAIQLDDSTMITFLVGDSVSRKMMATNAIPTGYGLFLVDEKGLITGAGSPSESDAWSGVFRSRDHGDVTVEGADYTLISAPIEAAGPSHLRMVAAIPTKPILAAASKGSRQAWTILGVGTLIFVAVALWVTSLLTRPLRSLTSAAQGLADGDLGTRADVRADDEIGALGTAFNTMSMKLQQRDSNLREALDKLTWLSETDPLTGLYNHRALHRQLEREVSRASRQGCPLSVAVIDIDDFKMINDTYGHPTGDQVIRQVAEVLAEHSRREDVVGRHGGDEFMLVLPETTSKDAVGALDKFRAAMQETPLLTEDGLQIPIRLSCGTASVPEDGERLHELVARADAHLYESKRKGGDMVTRAIEAQSIDDITGGGFGMLDSMVTAVDNKDRYTRRHSEDVTHHAMLMADQLNLSEESQRVLRAAGLLHDVGKIGVPDQLLRKPALLTVSEQEIVRHHAKLGGLLIQGLPDEAEIRRAVATHHERWDGAGYPAALRGEAIPLLGRILAVADAFSAMTSDRPYRKAMTREEALAELRASSGTQLDPQMVDAFFAAARSEELAELTA